MTTTTGNYRMNVDIWFENIFTIIYSYKKRSFYQTNMETTILKDRRTENLNLFLSLIYVSYVSCMYVDVFGQYSKFA